MLIYDVVYYRNGQQTADSDREVSDNYLEVVWKRLEPGETAYARCLNNPHEDRTIDKTGVHRVND